MADLIHTYLLQILHLDLKTGIWTWRVQPNGHVPAGSIAGTPKPRGNLEIKIDGKLYQASRLAWFYVHGRWPKREVDHKNLDPSDNRPSNLRTATDSQQGANRHRLANKNLNTPKGVSFHKASGKFTARIKVNQKHINLGLFPTMAEAHAAYIAAAKKYFGKFARWE